MQHIEEAGVHSGDSACSLPPYSLSAEIIAEVRVQTEALAMALNVVGLMNVQFAIKDDEDLPDRGEPARLAHRAFRRQSDGQRHRLHRRTPHGRRAAVQLPTAPALRIAADPMALLPLGDPFTLADPKTPWFSVKEAVLPFARFPGVDTILGPEMRSTGEVMGWDRSFPRPSSRRKWARARSCHEGHVFVSISDADKTPHAGSRNNPAGLGLHPHRPHAARRRLSLTHGIACETVNKVYEGGLTIVDRLKDGHIALVFNTTEGSQAVEDSRDIRAVALYDKIPYFTTAAGAQAAAMAMAARVEGGVDVRSLQG